MDESEWLTSDDPAAMLRFMTTRSAYVGHPGMPFISDRCTGRVVRSAISQWAPSPDAWTANTLWRMTSADQPVAF